MDKVRFQDNIAKVYDTAPRRGMARILNTLLGVYRIGSHRVQEIGIHDDAWISYKGKYVGCYRWIDTCPVFYFEGEFDKLYRYQYVVHDDKYLYPRMIPFFSRDRGRFSISLRDEDMAGTIYEFLREKSEARGRIGALLRQCDLSCTRNGVGGAIDTFLLYIPWGLDAISVANYINRHCVIEKPKPKPVRIKRTRKPKTTV